MVQDVSGYPCRDLNEKVMVGPSVDEDDRREVSRGKLDINLDDQIKDIEHLSIDLDHEHLKEECFLLTNFRGLVANGVVSQCGPCGHIVLLASIWNDAYAVVPNLPLPDVPFVVSSPFLHS